MQEAIAHKDVCVSLEHNRLLWNLGCFKSEAVEEMDWNSSKCHLCGHIKEESMHFLNHTLVTIYFLNKLLYIYNVSVL